MNDLNSKGVKSWVVTIVTEGLGAAFGVAIVAFVGYTAFGVYQTKVADDKSEERMRIIESRQIAIEKKTTSLERDMDERIKERSRELREEIIKSNQVALDLVIEEIKKSKPPKSNELLVDPLVEDLEQRDVKNALKHRFREAQQSIQQQEY